MRSLCAASCGMSGMKSAGCWVSGLGLSILFWGIRLRQQAMHSPTGCWVSGWRLRVKGFGCRACVESPFRLRRRLEKCRVQGSGCRV
jgi:hypothetical protein